MWCTFWHASFVYPCVCDSACVCINIKTGYILKNKKQNILHSNPEGMSVLLYGNGPPYFYQRRNMQTKQTRQSWISHKQSIYTLILNTHKLPRGKYTKQSNCAVSVPMKDRRRWSNGRYYQLSVSASSPVCLWIPITHTHTHTQVCLGSW